MSVDDITSEETQKIAGILETKWKRLVDDHTKIKAELEAEQVARAMTERERDYWHSRCLKAEERADHFCNEIDFLKERWATHRSHFVETEKAMKIGAPPNPLKIVKQPEPNAAQARSPN